MFLPLSEAPVEPLYQTAIVETLEVATPKPPEPEKPKELTLEEKIKRDINNCEPERYISAEDASCLPKPVITPQQPQNTARVAVNAPKASFKPGNGWFPYGQCTYFVWSQRDVGAWNNASEWLWQAQRDGWSTGSTPRVGAIAWEPNHVSLVIAVNGSNITVREMNYKGLGVVSTRTAPASQFRYIY